MNIIFIDSSYFIFHRMYALHVWWKNAHKDTPLENAYENEIFREKFISTFISKLQEIKKKFQGYDIIVAHDCPQKNIWRKELYPEYKQGRKTESYTGSFFSLVTKNELYNKAGIFINVSHPRLEADDCIAIATKHILKNYKDPNIVIITSDRDYLQLIDNNYLNNLRIIDVKFKSLLEAKSSFGDGLKDLFMKIFSGDKSDNIPPVFNRCGKKKLEVLYDNKHLVEEKLKKENRFVQFELNRRLIDFNYIPKNYNDEFLENLKDKINILKE